MKPKFFATQIEFRKWLEKNHKKEKELFIGYYKLNSGKTSMTWSESVDQALCFGWIDGLRRSIDSESYQNRFTPRKRKSNWSNINIKKVEMLTEQGLMHPAGIESFKNRTEDISGIYAFEKEELNFSTAFEKKFKENKTAWKYFQTLAQSYRKLSSNWVMSAKKEATRIKRLKELIADCSAGINKWKNNKYKEKK